MTKMLFNPETDCNIGIEKNNITICKKVGCGNLYVIFVEHKNGNFDSMKIGCQITKEAPCGESWTDGISALLTFSLRRAFKEHEDDPKSAALDKGIYKQLKNHSCNKRSVVTEWSCMSAIGNAIHEYIKIKDKK